MKQNTSISEITIKITSALLDMNIIPESIKSKSTFDDSILFIASLKNSQDFDFDRFSDITGISKNCIHVPDKILECDKFQENTKILTIKL